MGGGDVPYFWPKSGGDVPCVGGGDVPWITLNVPNSPAANGDISAESKFAFHPLFSESQESRVIVLWGFLAFQPTIERVLAGVGVKARVELAEPLNRRRPQVFDGGCG